MNKQLYVWEVTEEERKERPYYKLSHDDTLYVNDIYRVGGRPALWGAKMYTNEYGIIENERLRPATPEEIIEGVVVGSDAHNKAMPAMGNIEWVTDAEKEINGKART